MRITFFHGECMYEFMEKGKIFDIEQNLNHGILETKGSE